mgnify:FL=1
MNTSSRVDTCPVYRIHINLRIFLRYRKLVVSYNVKTLREDAITAQGKIA